MQLARVAATAWALAALRLVLDPGRVGAGGGTASAPGGGGTSGGASSTGGPGAGAGGGGTGGSTGSVGGGGGSSGAQGPGGGLAGQVALSQALANLANGNLMDDRSPGFFAAVLPNSPGRQARVISSLSDMIAARSRMLRSSRMFPGQV